MALLLAKEPFIPVPKWHYLSLFGLLAFTIYIPEHTKINAIRLPILNACFTSPSISADKITLQRGFTNPKIATLETSFYARSIDQSVYATAETIAR